MSDQLSNRDQIPASTSSDAGQAHGQSVFQSCAVTVQLLLSALTKLESSAQFLQAKPLDTREWFDLLRQKLAPQLGEQAWLVVAVVGGTNIGKSVVFNHLAGCKASASSPLASGTKHPVCLVPQNFSEQHSLQSVFPDFDLRSWHDADEALQETDANLLFWRTAPELPPSLLVLDTPDIDSDARVNWLRADAVRRSADVLIAVLTQQKYNDAAVKEFFRKAGSEDKAVIVVFNQCLIPEDEEYWPIWVKTFCDETGIQPDALFIAPGDRRAADELRLPFFERPWPVPDGWGADQVPVDDVPHDLSAELARLRFREIRMRTLKGSLHEILNESRGLPNWLRELSAASRELATTSERLTSETALKIRNWPAPANSEIVRHIRDWWQHRQHGWARRVNGFYNTIGAGILWPLRAARNAISGEPVPPMQEYRQREWSAVLEVVEELFDKLQWMAESGNHLIRPRIESVLEGASRSDLIRQLKSMHEQIDFDSELSTVVENQMTRFREDSPEVFKLYGQLNNVSAAVRPVTSVVMFTIGFGPAGEVVAPFVADAAAQAVVHVVADVAGGATAALAGEAAVSNAASTGSGLLQAWFNQLHSAFMARRAEWLTQLIHSELLGTLPEELRAAATLTQSDEYRTVVGLKDQLATIVREL
ncbi:MAG: GTPase domain-containing protein [Planctomycetaceae bacterium]